MLGVLFGTMSMIIVLSIFNGFDDVIKSLYRDVDSDLKIELNEGVLFNVNEKLLNDIKEVPGVYDCVEVLEYKMLAQYDDYQSVIDAKGVGINYSNVSNLANQVNGFTTNANNNIFTSTNFVIVGSGVFNALSLKLLDYENTLRLSFFADAKNVLDLNNYINTRNFYVTEVFHSKVEIDNTHIFLNIEDLRNFLRLPKKCSSIEISLQKGSSIADVKQGILDVVGSKFLLKNKSQQRPFVYKMIQTEKLVVYIIFTFILFISMISLGATLMILLMEKQHDIRVLSYLGLGLQNIKLIFLTVGMLVTITGLCLGSIIGFIICFLQDSTNFIKLSNQGAFFIDAYPVQVNLSDVLLIQLIVVILGFLTSYFITFQNRFYPIS